MEDNQIDCILSLFAECPRCFTLEELADFADSDSDKEILRHALMADSRFVQFEEKDSGQKHLISQRSLFNYFCRLSVRLARARQARLDKRQLALLMSSLRIHDRWDTPPTGAMQFGSHFGLVVDAYTADQYVFPVAHVLSFMKFPTAVINAVIERFQTLETSVSVFEEVEQQLIQDGFYAFREIFGQNVRYVVQAREGLLAGKRMTLQQIGTQLGGFTREWARQLEAQFWANLQKSPRGRSLSRVFATALVCDVIANKGRLVIPKCSPQMFLLGFVAKCAGVPWAIFPDTEIAVLGISQRDLLSSRPTNSAGPIQGVTDAHSVAAWLESQMHLCLTHTDLRAIAEGIVQSRRNSVTKPLSKGQMAYLALRTIGSPAHYTRITEVYNSLFPDQPTTARNLHAVLARETHGIVWIGIRGTFALKEWGYEHPSMGLFDIATEVVKEKYEETSQPVPLTVIVAEIGKRRRLANPASLIIATQCNPNLRRVGRDSFVPNKPSDEIQGEISEDELDRILREFGKKDDKQRIQRRPASISGKRSHSSQPSRAVLALKEKIASPRAQD